MLTGTARAGVYIWHTGQVPQPQNGPPSLSFALPLGPHLVLFPSAAGVI